MKSRTHRSEFVATANGCRKRDRLRRLALVDSRVEAAPMSILADTRPWIAMVSSRLGHDLSRYREVSRFLSWAMLDCNRRGGVAIIAIGSAIELLAVRAAELFRVPMLRVGIASDNSERLSHANLVIDSLDDQSLDRDEVVIMLADRVDVLSARSGGKIARYAEQRIRQMRDASTRVAVVGPGHGAAQQLIVAGGVGWFLGRSDSSESESDSAVNDEADSAAFEAERSSHAHWMVESGEWLAHCTRGRSDPWPDETENQFRDEILLNDSIDSERSAFQTLVRIVRGGKLLACCQTSDHRWPVVCFSAVPVAELLQQRRYRSHLHRWDYEPFGVALRVQAASSIGIRPVLYGDPGHRRQLPAEDRYLFQAKGKTFDWTVEQEWRGCHDVDLHQFGIDDVRIFTATEEQAVVLRRLCCWRVDAVQNAS